MKFFIPFAAIALLTACGGSAPKSTAAADTAAGNILTPAHATGAQENAPAYTLSPSQMSDLAIDGLRGNVRAITYLDSLGHDKYTSYFDRYENDTILHYSAGLDIEADTGKYAIFRIHYTDNERIERHDPVNGVYCDVEELRYTFDSLGRIIKSFSGSLSYGSIDTYQYKDDSWLPSVKIYEFGSEDGSDSNATHYTYPEVDSVGNWLRRSSVEYKKSWRGYDDLKEKEVIIWDTVRGPTEARRLLYYDK